MIIPTNHLQSRQLASGLRSGLILCLVTAFLVAGSLLPEAVAAPANDMFSAQPILEGATNVVGVSSAGSSAEAGEPGHAGSPAAASVWWTWIAPDSGPVIINTLGSGFDTRLAVYVGDTVDDLVSVASNDDAHGLATSAVAFQAVQGTSYRIAVDGYEGAVGDVRLGIRLAVPSSAPSIVRQPVSIAVPSQTKEEVGFSVLAVGSLPLQFRWQHDGSDLPAGTNASLNLSPFGAPQSGDYRVIVSNPYGSVTSSVVSLTLLAEAANDRFADRLPIAGTSYAGGAHNLGATMDSGEPMHAGTPCGASLWWTWTAPSSGLVRVDTGGSTNLAGGVLDTVLAVYTGASLETLKPVVANDDQSLGTVVTSRTWFRAAVGTTYSVAAAGRLQADGLEAAGFVALNLELAPDNDRFDNALIFPAGVTQVFDNNVGASKEPGEPSHAGNEVGKSVWWTWLAPDDGTYVLDTVGSGIDTVLAVYTGDAVNALSLVGEDDNRSDDGASLVTFYASKGTAYRFAVDGYKGANGAEEGPITINLNPAALPNDYFSHRLTVSGSTNRVMASNLGAGKELGEPNHGNNAGGRSLWWTWTPRSDGPVVITTRGSTIDTTLAVYTGTQLSNLILVAENDDSNPLKPEAGSTVVFAALAGQSYQIAVDGYREDDGSVAAGTIVLTIAQANPEQPGGNDNFANRFVITGSTNVALGNNSEATKEAAEPSHAGNEGGKSIWWSWVSPSTAPVRIGAAGRGFDTVLAVYRGSSLDSLSLVASDDDSGEDGASSVTFEAVEGVEYQIAVDGFNDGNEVGQGWVAIGLVQYSSEPLNANDQLANASPISDSFPEVFGSNIGATREAGEPSHVHLSEGHSVWWSWLAEQSGPVTISTEGSQFDTVLAVYTGSDMSNLSLVGDNDDIDLRNLRSRVTFQAAAGTRYLIAVDGYAGQIGLIRLEVASDGRSDLAPQIIGNPEAQTRFANGEGGGTNVVFRALATGSAPLSFRWYRDGELIPGATGNDLTVRGVTSQDAGLYEIEVSNPYGTVRSRPADLFVAPVAFNDNFFDRITVTGTSNVMHGSVLGASKEFAEPAHAGQAGGRSVWWKWTAPSNGPAEIRTSGSNFDTLLAVYTGSELSNLQKVAQNDDISREIAFSRVVFDAVAGIEYSIAVDGFKTNGTSGSVLLTVLQPPLGPQIKVQPTAFSLVPITEKSFSLTVDVDAAGQSTVFQWFFNGEPISNATNSSYLLGQLSRASSGEYQVIISSDLGSVRSSPATLQVEVPQRLRPPLILPDGTLQLRFSDVDGSLAPNADRFEIQSRSLLGPDTLWSSTPGTILNNGDHFLFEDGSNRNSDPGRIYRVIEH